MAKKLGPWRRRKLGEWARRSGKDVAARVELEPSGLWYWRVPLEGSKDGDPIGGRERTGQDARDQADLALRRKTQ